MHIVCLYIDIVFDYNKIAANICILALLPLFKTNKKDALSAIFVSFKV